jgi:hypothetical protein
MDIDKKPPGEHLEGAGVPALPLIFPRVIADGKNQVRKSLAGRSPSMGELPRMAPNQCRVDSAQRTCSIQIVVINQDWLKTAWCSAIMTA